jgi:cysteine synthase
MTARICGLAFTCVVDPKISSTSMKILRLREEGILAGGSSGSIISILQRFLPTLPSSARVLTVLPDRGERYMAAVYNEERADHLPIHEHQPFIQPSSLVK